ncbi:MAG: hypothetical protein Kow002_19780 [Anaerolineales bacterium]
MKKRKFHLSAAVILLMAALACSLPGLTVNPTQAPVPPTATQPSLPTNTPLPPPTSTVIPSPTAELPTPTIEVKHAIIPASSVEISTLHHDVTSVDTASENRAPYGDSYDRSLFERPFTQDMQYIPDLDIASFNLSSDEKFYFVSIELVGPNPNNEIGIQYAVELDMDADGFGDFIIVAYPPHGFEWTTDNVRVYQDTDHDTGGLSAEKSDAPLPGDGYDTLIFDSGRGENNDPDLAWVRVNAGKYATVQFAFKVSWAGPRFMYGVMADASHFSDVAEMDYVDRLTYEEAGSPVRGKEEYPLKGLYQIDNTCWEVHGMKGTGEEPKLCPRD